jgi:predicted secreted protein
VSDDEEDPEMTSNRRTAVAAGRAARVAVVAAGLFVALLMPGGALASDQSFDRGDSKRQVTVPEGTSIFIDLPSNASTGYTWIVATEPDSSVLQAGPSSGEYTAPEGDVPGAEGMQSFAYTAVASGSTWLLLHYVAPGTHDVGDAFELYVDVGPVPAPSARPSAGSGQDEMPATASSDPLVPGPRGGPDLLVAAAIMLGIALVSGSILAGLDRMANPVPVEVDPIDAHRRRPHR